VGRTFDEAIDLFAQARRVRDSGAKVLIIEGITTKVAETLAKPHDGALPIYGIFSGLYNYSGQSINVWDTFFKPNFSNKYFPPTATHSLSETMAQYNPTNIAPHVFDLMQLITRQKFPLYRSSDITLDQEIFLESMNPWKNI
jgi:ketopantoate hydroxymethyltransferase